jgi:XLF-Cernunnos, XRcc4-like factor, NHEJ component
VERDSAEEMSPRWQSLPTRKESAPLLLYSFSYTSRSYEFYLTDLTYIWLERLDHKHILLRAEDSETSIDPSEDANQYAVFMQKIQDALHGAKSSIVNVTTNRKPVSLTVTTSTGLPGGLKPLEWSFSLSREPPSAVTQQLLLPLLKGEREREKREQSLLDHIKDKDNVLSKIFDKLDASQLTTMFPGTAGTRHARPKTSDLIKHIKGATRFDEKEWCGNFEYAHTVVSDIEGLAESVSKFTSSTISDAWWENLDDDELTSKPSPKPQGADARRKDYTSAIDTDIEAQKTLDEDESTEDEDEFQVRGYNHTYQVHPNPLLTVLCSVKRPRLI